VQTVATSTGFAFTTLFVSPLSQPAGQEITFTATVSSTFAGSPTGNVAFTITDSNGTTLSRQAQVEPASGGLFQATCYLFPTSAQQGANTCFFPSSYPASPAGAYDVLSVTASYGGDENFSESSSASQSFALSPASGSVAITPSGTSLASGGIPNTTITFSNTSYGGWQGVVGYQCLASSLPANAICVFSPGQVSVMANTAGVSYPLATTQLTVVVNNPPNSPAQSSMLWWLGGLTGLLLFRTRRRFMRRAWGKVALLIGAALLAVSASGLMACNTGVKYTTPTGKSTITVVASTDPYVSPVASPPVTQPCGGSPKLAPCSQPTFQITLTVE
jgi:hypothetical protein